MDDVEGRALVVAQGDLTTAATMQRSGSCGEVVRAALGPGHDRLAARRSHVDLVAFAGELRGAAQWRRDGVVDVGGH